MNMLNFTVEEINLIDIYNKPGPARRKATKTQTVSRIAEAAEFMDDDIKEIAVSAAVRGTVFLALQTQEFLFFDAWASNSFKLCFIHSACLYYRKSPD